MSANIRLGIVFTILSVSCLSRPYIANAAAIHVPEDFATIQAAIDSSANGDTILVDSGIYVENIDFKGKAILLSSRFLISGDTSDITNTVIDGGQSGTVVTFNSDEDTNSVLSGFTVMNGYAENGGGLAVIRSNPRLEYLKVANNIALNQGGGIFVDSGNPTLNNLIIEYNRVTAYAGIGAGLFLYETNAAVNSSIIRHNSSEWDNSSAGGIAIYGHADVRILNTLIIDNKAAYGGGIWCSASSNPKIINVTIANNAGGSGEGIFMSNNASMEIINSILWNNGEEEVELRDVIENALALSYSTIMGGRDKTNVYNDNQIGFGDGISTSDPKFMNITNENYYLLPLSPSINAGDPDTAGLGIPTADLAENPRIVGERIDMGAYEFQGDPVHYVPPNAGFDILPPTGIAGTSFRLDASASSDNLDPASSLLVRWDWQSDGAWDTDFSAEKTFEHAYAEAGIYTVTLELKDTDGFTARKQKTLIVANDFNRELTYTVSGDQGSISAPFLNTSLSLRFLTGSVAGKSISVAGFGDSLPDSLQISDRFEKAVGYYALSSDDIASFSGTLKFTYGDSIITALSISEDSLRIAFYDETLSRWRAAVTTINKDSNTASATIDHFSLWALTDRSDDLITGLEGGFINPGTVASFQLRQNYPNPFNPITSIRFSLPKEERVRIAIYNILGQKVRLLSNEPFSPGEHAVAWDGRDDSGRLLASGVYIYEFRVGEFIERKKMTLLR